MNIYKQKKTYVATISYVFDIYNYFVVTGVKLSEILLQTINICLWTAYFAFKLHIGNIIFVIPTNYLN